jgi:hypothetical protein
VKLSNLTSSADSHIEGPDALVSWQRKWCRRIMMLRCIYGEDSDDADDR